MSYISNNKTIREKTDYFYIVIIYIFDACQQFSSSSVMHNLKSNLTWYWPAVFQGYYHNQHFQKCFIVAPVTTHCSSQWAPLSWKDIQECFTNNLKISLGFVILAYKWEIWKMTRGVKNVTLNFPTEGQLQLFCHSHIRRVKGHMYLLSLCTVLHMSWFWAVKALMLTDALYSSDWNVLFYINVQNSSHYVLLATHSLHSSVFMTL